MTAASPYWRADVNDGISLESLAKEITSYKPGASFEEDYEAFRTLFQVLPHPRVMPVALVSSPHPDAKEGEEGEEKPAQYQCSIRNYVLDLGTTKCLSCVLPLHLNITEMFLYNAGMTAEAIELLATTLPKCATLEKVHLEYNRLPENPQLFAKFLAENVPARSVSLRGNCLRNSGAIAVADVLARNTWVLTLNLFDNNIGDEGAAAILTKARYNTTLKTLSLSNNKGGDDALHALVTTLVGGPIEDPAKAEYNEHATRLLDLNKAISTGKKPKAKPGELPPPNIEEVPLLENLVSVDGVDYARGNRILEIVNFSNNKVTNTGAVDVVALFNRDSIDGLDFKFSKSVREVNLTRNSIEEDAGLRLAAVSDDKIVL